MSFFNYVFPLQRWFLGNELEFYRLNSRFSNPRMGLSRAVCNDEKEVQRFILGIYNESNDRSAKTNSTLERYKSIVMMNSTEM